MAAEEKALDLSYLRPKASGFYWEPGKHVKALGFQGKPLGKDRVAAEIEADRLNREVARERQRLAELACPVADPQDTVKWVIDQYRVDDSYLELAPKTRRGYDQCIDRILEWCGDLKVANVTPKAIRDWYRTMRKETPSFANAILRVLSIVMRHAIVEGLIEVNPCKATKLIGTPPRRQIWTDAALHAFCRMAMHKGYPSVALAVTLDFNMGQREGDILALGWAQWTGAGFQIRQRKTNAFIEVPFIADVLEVVKAACEAKESTMVLLCEDTGQPWKEDHFRHVVATIREAAVAGSNEAGLGPCPELDGLWFMDLRRTAVVTLARAGATIAEITAITGHTTASAKQIIDTYLPRDTEMAKNAVVKLQAYRDAKKTMTNG